MEHKEKDVIQKRLLLLQQHMKEKGLDFYLLPMCDYHGSEYISDHFKLIRYFSGFTGSAASLVISREGAYLWTDGRYFLQAEKELKGTGILLMKQGQEQVPTVTQFLAQGAEKLTTETVTVGFDARLVSCRFADRLKAELSEAACGKKLVLSCEEDAAGSLWQQDEEDVRPARPAEKLWILEEIFAGESMTEKLKKCRDFLSQKRADILLLTCLDEIAYLTNLRGSDVAYTPVFLSYMILSQKEARLYLQKEALDEEVRSYLTGQDIEIRKYESFYEDVERLSADKTVVYDRMSANYLVEKKLHPQAKRLDLTSPVIGMKAVKNETELKHIKEAHRKDGVAVTKFLFWLKTKVRSGEEAATEISAAEKLDKLRRQGEHYLGQSFAPIIAYGPNGAIVHYSADEESNAEILPEGFLLADTGGHYLEGTTDITRTVVMGELTREQRRHYTAVLCGNLRLMDACFKAGSQGANLDYLAREPLYRMGLDFNHGTGHGVGYLLNVHEGPNAFRQKAEDGAQLIEGMITSDEPGFYLEGSYGIRLENLILCKKKEKTPYGQFMGFEPLTLVPFDLEAVDTDYMEKRDIALLNAYHELVYQTISPYLSHEEAEWLKEETRPL